MFEDDKLKVTPDQAELEGLEPFPIPKGLCCTCMRGDTDIIIELEQEAWIKHDGKFGNITKTYWHSKCLDLTGVESIFGYKFITYPYIKEEV